MTDTAPFYVDRAKGGRASCKGCKSNCPSGELRIAKQVPSPYGDGQQMKSWYHINCFMDALLKQRPATKRVDSIDDIGNWDNICKEDQELILKKLNETEKLYADKNNGKYTAKVLKNVSLKTSLSNVHDTSKNTSDKHRKTKDIEVDDDKFSHLYDLCQVLAKTDAYTDKTSVMNNFFTRGLNKKKFEGDISLWCKLMLPQVSKRVYNLKSKQLVKLFSKIFSTDHDDILTHLEQGDIGETIPHFFLKSKFVEPAKESTLTIHNVEQFLEDLSKLTKEEEQIYNFKKIIKKCTVSDLKMIIRLIKGDLRINAGPKHVLDAIHPNAYSVFQMSRDLDMVLDRVLSDDSSVKHKDSIQTSIEAKVTIMTPVLPMLAEACKSVEMAMRKCPNGMFSEIKYDGERVQVHKKGKEFKYFSRSLKPVMSHKVSHFKDFLSQAFPKGTDLILDSEVLMIDVNTGKPLPFGTLGIHKQSEFKDAQVCLFVFDCLYYNGQVLIDLPIRERRQILYDNMVEVKNHVMFSEQKLIEKSSDLAKMIAEVLQLGLEGLVLKDLESVYAPGKRHWLKVKKDYLFDGAIADCADLVVLGAWFGTGKKGGLMSVFLMGCLDNYKKKWVTVTKVHTGHDDSTLERLQKELTPLMVKISQDYNKVPSWLDCKKGMVPDFVASDPKAQPVWEITGNEFTKANLHTADGISIRFPRVTKIRNDKDWKTATNLEELKHLFKTSKEKMDMTLLNKLADTANDEPVSKKMKPSTPKKSPVKRKVSPTTTLNGYVIKKEKKATIKLDTSDASDKTISDVDMKESDFIQTENVDSKDFLLSINKTEGSKKVKKPKMKLDTSDDSDKTISDINMKELNSIEANKVDSKDVLFSKKERDILKKDKKTKIKLDKSDDSDKTISDVDVKEDEETDEVDSKKFLFLPMKPLPDIFKDKRLGFYPDFISFPEDERKHFERHWIAYGGTVVKSIRCQDIDFLLHNKKRIEYEKMKKLKRTFDNNVKHVYKDWLMKCINDVTLCDTNKFAIYVKP